jgi:hypothetical protein
MLLLRYHGINLMAYKGVPSERVRKIRAILNCWNLSAKICYFRYGKCLKGDEKLSENVGKDVKNLRDTVIYMFNNYDT